MDDAVRVNKYGRTETSLAAAMLPRPLSPEESALQKRLFLEAVEPIHQMKMHLYSIYLPTLILDNEGKLISAAYPDEMQDMIRKLDKMIEEVAAQWHQH